MNLTSEDSDFTCVRNSRDLQYLISNERAESQVDNDPKTTVVTYLVEEIGQFKAFVAAASLINTDNTLGP